MSADFTSAFSIGAGLHESAWDLTLDAAGNTCVVGRFTGTVDFDPGPGTNELTSTPAGTGNTFAAKYDPNGNILWAQQFGGNLNNFGPEIAAGTDGSVVVVGSFSASAQFGTTTLTSLGSNDAYAVKLDAAGNIMWAHRFGGVNDDHGNSVAFDNVGNVYVLAETTTAASGGRDVFFAKIDSNGIVQWTKAVGASNSLTTKGNTTSSTGWARGFKLTVDSTGDVYATGRVGGTVDFDPGPGTIALSGTTFVMKLTSGGDLSWARTFVGGYLEAHDIAVDGNGTVYSTGMYSGTVDFDPGRAKFSINSGSDQNRSVISATYVSALNSSGNFLWAKSTQSVGGTPYSAISEAIAVDVSGGIHITGSFSGMPDFDTGAGTFTLTSTAFEGAFVWTLDAGGAFVWAGRTGGTARGIGIGAAGDIFVAGDFSGTADFDPTTGTYNLTSAGGSDFFVAKLIQSSPLSLAYVGANSSKSLLDTSTESNGTYVITDDETLKTDPAQKLTSRRAIAIDLALADFDFKLRELLLLTV